MPYGVAYGKHKPFCNGRCMVADVGSMNLMPLSFGINKLFCRLHFPPPASPLSSARFPSAVRPHSSPTGMIVIPCTLFFMQVAPFVARVPGGEFAVLLVVATMCISLYNLVTAWATEPVPLPKRNHNPSPRHSFC